MLSAVQFNDQPSLKAAEIGEELPDRVVASEFGAAKSAAVTQPPQLSFGLGLISAQ
jgi:hypothetical protein